MQAYPITLIIIAVTVITSIRAFDNAEFKYQLIFSPYQVMHHKKWSKVLSHAFIHADWMHLGLNMFVLYNFGRLAELFFVREYGAIGYGLYLLLYVLGIAFATIPALYKHKNNDLYLSLGASGAVSSVLFACILIYPGAPLGILFLPFEIPAVVFGPLYLLFEFYMGKRNKGRIAHDAHFAGAVFGIIFMLILDSSRFINNFVLEVQDLLN